MAATVTPQELGQILDVAGAASLPLAQAHRLGPVLAKLIALANQPHPIGALVPETIPAPTQSEVFPDATEANG